MFRSMCKSKIHKATVTDCKLDYEGSINIDETLMKEADILPGEKLHILNLNNGARFETYAICAKPGSGHICLNGAAARLGEKGDKVIIISYCIVEDARAKDIKCIVIHVDEKNSIIK